MMFILLLPVVAALAVGSESVIRIAGLFLQILGIATVAWNLRGMRQSFNRPSVIKRAWAWWGRRPKYNKNQDIPLSGVSSKFTLGEATLESWHSIPADADLERKVFLLDTNLNWLRGYFTNFRTETEMKERECQDLVKTETESRQKEIGMLADRFESIQFGSFDIAVIGLVFLLVGLIMSSISIEISNIVSPTILIRSYHYRIDLGRPLL